MVPITWQGKLIASCCALLGISFFALPAVSDSLTLASGAPEEASAGHRPTAGYRIHWSFTMPHSHSHCRAFWAAALRWRCNNNSDRSTWYGVASRRRRSFRPCGAAMRPMSIPCRWPLGRYIRWLCQVRPPRKYPLRTPYGTHTQCHNIPHIYTIHPSSYIEYFTLGFAADNECQMTLDRAPSKQFNWNMK